MKLVCKVSTQSDGDGEVDFVLLDLHPTLALNLIDKYNLLKPLFDIHMQRAIWHCSAPEPLYSDPCFLKEVYHNFDGVDADATPAVIDASVKAPFRPSFNTESATFSIDKDGVVWHFYQKHIPQIRYDTVRIKWELIMIAANSPSIFMKK